MFHHTKEELAIYGIGYYLENHTTPAVSADEVPEIFWEHAACFVTLYVNKMLRGCIGSCLACQPLYRNIVDYAIRSAAYDYRFPPLTLDELPQLTAEVSVLSPLQEVDVTDLSRFLTFLYEEKPGVMLQRNGLRALFLQQVWRNFRSPEAFLSVLCEKAGLPAESWKAEDTQYWIFRNRGDI